MNVGDSVKVKPYPERDLWIRGKVLAKQTAHPGDPVLEERVYKIGFGEFSSYQEAVFERANIKSYVEQTDEQHIAEVNRDMPLGLALANEALAELLPGEVVVFKDADNELSGYGGAVTISPTQYDQPKIGGLIEKTGYDVIEWSVVPGNRWNPDETVDAPVGTFPTIQQAVDSMIQTIFKLKSRDFWTARTEALPVIGFNSWSCFDEE